MPRKYDRIIRFYDSWFGDLMDPEKEFTPAECWEILLAIRDCQLQGSLDPLKNLPLSIRRALSMATMGEQIERILERIESRRKTSSAGGNAAAANQRTPEQAAAAKIRAEREEQERNARDEAYKLQSKNAITPSDYNSLLIDAANGSRAAIEKLKLDQAAAIDLARRKGLI